MNNHNNKSLNQIISEYAGVECVQLCKRYEREMIKMNATQEDITFNTKCLTNGLIPIWAKVKPRLNHPDAHKAAKTCSLNYLKIKLKQDKARYARLTLMTSAIFDEICNQLPFATAQK